MAPQCRVIEMKVSETAELKYHGKRFNLVFSSLLYTHRVYNIFGVFNLSGLKHEQVRVIRIFVSPQSSV